LHIYRSRSRQSCGSHRIGAPVGPTFEGNRSTFGYHWGNSGRSLLSRPHAWVCWTVPGESHGADLCAWGHSVVTTVAGAPSNGPLISIRQLKPFRLTRTIIEPLAGPRKSLTPVLSRAGVGGADSARLPHSRARPMRGAWAKVNGDRGIRWVVRAYPTYARAAQA
jgi:hypothetical protein